MEKSQNNHKYDPVDNTKEEIRLLILEPANSIDDPIQCHLVHKSLHLNPRYETLSYYWGNPEITDPILLHGQSFQATKNLVSALRHLRKIDEERTLWIDALCINQRDMEEREEQVKIMRKIYESSWRTMLWLGHECVSKPLSWQTLDLLRHPFPQKLRDGADEARDRLLSMDQSSLRTFASELCGVMTWNDVWNRVWVAQEVTLAHELVLLYGSQELSWWSITCFFHGIYEMLRISFDSSIGQQFVEKNANMTVFMRRITAFDGNVKGFTPSLFATYIAFGNLKATNSLDHIYALLGLSDVKCLDATVDSTANLQEDVKSLDITADDTAKPQKDVKSLDITINYLASPQELLRNVVRSHIRKYHNLDFLELSSVYDSDSEERWETSWTPNIHTPIRVFPLAQSVEVVDKKGIKVVNKDGITQVFPTYAAGLSDMEEFSWACIEDVSDLRKLILAGIELDTVKEITSTSSAVHLSFEDTKKMFQKTLPADATTTEYFGQTSLDAYWRTLMFDATALDRIQYWQMEGFRNAFQGILDGRLELHAAQNPQAFWSNMQQILVSFAAGTIKCSFGITLNGFMARFPVGTQEGDIVAVLYGGRTPFILRPKSEKNTEYLLVGPAYVHGFMDGEVFAFRNEGVLQAREFVLV